jgi:all-trans-retinol 13,14-reductase
MSSSSFKQSPSLPSSWDVLCIGSGIGALATAAVLAKHAGKRVLVLERHYTAGGYTHAFHRPGYSWDVGVHYIGQVHDSSLAVRRAFDYLTNGQLQWAPMPDVYDRILINGRTYEFPSGTENFRAQLKRYFPNDAAAIDRYVKAVQSSNRASGLYFAEKAMPRPIAAVAGSLMRHPFLRWAGRTTLEVLSEYTSNQELIGVLTAQWGDYGLPPAQSSFAVHAMIAAHYWEGASYPIGGSSRIAETIAPLIEAAGGQILVGAEVKEILLERGKAVGVRMADGRELRAGTIVSDAGARNTFEKLLPAEASPKLDNLRAEVRAVPPSKAYLSLYVGLKHTARELGLDGTNLWIHPTPDHDANLRRFSADPTAPFPLLFVSFPSAKDPDFETRHPGRSTIEVITFANYDWFSRWENSRWHRRGDDYDGLKQQLATRLQAELERYVPAVAGKIDCAELSTPLSTRHFMNYERGEAYGLSATPERFRLRGLRPRTPIANLYLTGQDVSVLGVTGAMFGGVLTASAILGGNLMSVVTGPSRSTGHPAAAAPSRATRPAL